MGKNTQGEAEALVAEFMRRCVDQKDGAGASLLLTKASREAGQFDPASIGGGTYKVGAAQAEGAGFVVPVVMANEGQSMTVQVVTVQEEGAWRVDLAATGEKMMAGMQAALESAMGTVGEAMGKAMEGVGAALGEALGGEPAQESPKKKGKHKKG